MFGGWGYRGGSQDYGIDPVQDALSDKEEIARLKKLLQQREEELETLGKALAFFARRADQQ